LNGVGTRFVPPFSTGDVPGDVVVGKRDEVDRGGDHAPELDVAVAQADAGQDVVTATRQSSQHAGDVSVVGRFAEDVVVEDDGGVGAKEKRGQILICSFGGIGPPKEQIKI
jgi:hypothetical protein